jgi:hypothetical protein
LDGIGRQFIASQDQPGGSVQLIERICGERGEGVVIALPCAKNEVSMHPSSDLWRPGGRTHPS